MGDFAALKYDQTLVSYIDVLGFAEILKARSPTDVARLLSTMKHNFSAGGRVGRTHSDEIVRILKFFNFSDLIVRTTRIEPATDLGKIVDWELYYLSEHHVGSRFEVFWKIISATLLSRPMLDLILAQPELWWKQWPAIVQALSAVAQVVTAVIIVYLTRRLVRATDTYAALTKIAVDLSARQYESDISPMWHL